MSHVNTTDSTEEIIPKDATVVFRITKSELDELVTKKDLKISLFEFAKEYKLEWMNIKINFLFAVIALSSASILTMLFTIVGKLK